MWPGQGLLLHFLASERWGQFPPVPDLLRIVLPPSQVFVQSLQLLHWLKVQLSEDKRMMASLWIWLWFWYIKSITSSLKSAMSVLVRPFGFGHGTVHFLVCLSTGQAFPPPLLGIAILLLLFWRPAPHSFRITSHVLQLLHWPTVQSTEEVNVR